MPVRAYVRFWHIADVPLALANVRFEGKNRHDAAVTPFPLMTHSGRRSQVNVMVCSFFERRHRSILSAIVPQRSKTAIDATVSYPTVLKKEGLCECCPGEANAGVLRDRSKLSLRLQLHGCYAIKAVMLRKLSSLALAALLLSSAVPVAAQMNTQKHPSVPPSQGSAQPGTTQVPSQKVEGGQYPHQPPRMDKDVNSGAPPVPTNPEAATKR